MDFRAVEATIRFFEYECYDLLQIDVPITGTGGTPEEYPEIGRASIYVVAEQEFIDSYRDKADMVSEGFVNSFTFLTTMFDDATDGELKEVYGSIAYIERFVIDAQYRNQGIGGKSLHEIIMMLSRIGVNFIILKPFPLECEGQDRSDLIEPGVARLQSFYSRFGFQLISAQDEDKYMILQLA